MENQTQNWTVTIRTNVSVDSILPIKSGTEKSLSKSFNDFANAKKYMQNLIKGYANTPNYVFNEYGRIIGLKEYFDDLIKLNIYASEESDDFDDDFLDDEQVEVRAFWNATKLSDIIKSYTKNPESFSFEKLTEFIFSDYKLKCQISDGELLITGHLDGSYNGVDPYILINTFNMDNPEKEYHFRILNNFNNSQEYIYIDMTCAQVNE